ncbi:MAG: hypothetical protein LC658_11270 [Bacteroidales bacterium]|nr:hypothetical protein [Bacteroidales bacterium]
MDKIIRCQGEGNYTHIWFTDGKHLLVAKTLVKLNASVTFDGERITVSNNDTIDFLNTEMTVNSYYKLTGMNLPAGETFTLWPVEFAHINGTRLPAKQIPQQFSIWCELNDGKNGFYSKNLK